MRKFSCLLLIVISLLVGIQSAQAHGYVVRSVPDDRSTLDHPPARLQYWFSEDLEPEFSQITLRDQTGAILAEGAVDADNRALLTLQVPADLSDGAYIVDLRPAFASDGHVVVETRVFFVGEEVGGIDSEQAGYEVIPLEVFWRILLLAGTLLLFGAFVIYSYVLLPAWGNPRYPAGLLPPRVLQRLNRLVIAGLTIAVVGNLVAIVQQSMVFFSADVVQVFEQGLWHVVRIGSRFGDVWTARMVLLVLVGGFWLLSTMWRDEYPETVRAFWAANVWVAALLLGAFSITSHAAGSLIWPWVAMAVDWVHTLAVGAWVGGLAALVLVLPVALQPYAGDDRRQALLIVLRRFSRLAVSALVLVIATGIYSALNWLYQPTDLVQTAWGGALIVKLALVGSVLILGLAHHIAANPERFARWQQRLGHVGRLILTLRVEVMLALVVLVSVANLSASAVPEPVFLSDIMAAPSATQVIDDLTVSLTISPGGPGVNTFDTVLRRAEQVVDRAQVAMQIVSPTQDWRSNWVEVPVVNAGLHVTAGAEIVTEGQWLTLLDITLPEGEKTRVAFLWDITEAAAVPDSLDPSPLQLLAFVGLLMAVVWVAYPLLLRFYRWLDWRPVSIAIGASAVLGTVLFIWIGIIVVQQSTANYNAQLNPPPAIINSVLPDAASLERGAVLYAEHCIQWQVNSTDFRALTDRLPRMRDEDLFRATETGWRDLPPCTGDLSIENRWHIVNYFRTLA